MTIRLLGEGSLYDVHRRKQDKLRRTDRDRRRAFWFTVAAFTVIAGIIIGVILWL